LKPSFNTNQQHYEHQNENEINEIMTFTSSRVKDEPTEQHLGSTRPIHGQAEYAVVDVDDDDDFMTRIVDGTCRGIFPSSDDDRDKHSLCHLPSCHLGENLNVLIVCTDALA
jgi:hypothetical protein